MNSEDAERVRTPKAGWAPGMRCAICGLAPTCPQLADDVWAEAWAEANARGLLRAPTCTAGDHPRLTFRCNLVPPDEWHSRVCEIVRGVREMLCLECAEACLGRELTTDDLESCVANYAHVVMQARAEREWFVAGLEVEASGDIARYEDLAAPGGYKRATDRAFAELRGKK